MTKTSIMLISQRPLRPTAAVIAGVSSETDLNSIFSFLILIGVRLAFAKPCAGASAACRVVSAKFKKKILQSFRKLIFWSVLLHAMTLDRFVYLSGLAVCCYCCNSFVSTYGNTFLRAVWAREVKFYSMALPWDSSLYIPYFLLYSGLFVIHFLLCMTALLQKKNQRIISFKKDLMLPHAFHEVSAKYVGVK